MTETRTLQLADATISYDIAEVPGSTHPPIVLIGQPMTSEGFDALAAELTDRTVVRYDPRGLGRSTRADGSTAHDPVVQAGDVHALIAEVSGGEPVDMFASSGGAVTSLALVAQHPGDLRVCIAHEPPIFAVLPDADLAFAASARNDAAYQAGGFGAGMAAFIQLVSHEGEFTADYLDQPLPDPASFGLPTDDDGSRDDPLMGGDSAAVTRFAPDIEAVQEAATRVVVGVGAASGHIVTAGASRALAVQLGAEPVEFRGGHGGFAADEWGQPGDPATFAQQVRDAIEAAAG